MIRWTALLVVAGCSGGTDKDPSVTTTTTTTDIPDPPDDTADTFHDPLSMPAEATLAVGDFASAETCAGCHPDHTTEWKRSVHASAMVDPVFRGLVEVRQADFDGAQDPFCTQCHSAIGTRALDIAPGFSWDDLDDVTLEGVTCEACHKVDAVVRTHNAGHTLDPDGPMRGPILDPIESGYHTSEGSDLLSTSEFCGSCHDVFEVSGLPLERPYAEWTTSPGRNDGMTCQTCHMDTRTGPAAVGGPDRTLHDHSFVGVDVPLLDDWLSAEDEAALHADISDLLTGAATVMVDAPVPVAPGGRLDVVVTLRNELPAHNLPTGSTFNRQCWLELTVVDATGRALYETGTLDENDDLRNRWSDIDPYGDDDLIELGSGFVDENGEPTLFTHRATEHTSKSLQPLQTRTHTLFVDVPDDVVGPLTVSARLRFRALGPFLLRLLGLDDQLHRLVITDIDATVAEVALVE